jgi:glycine dehydrogenase subunit 1
MLEACGANSLEDLFRHLPTEIRLKKPLKLPPNKSEYEILHYFNQLGAQNANRYASFLGAGVYYHYQPALVDAIASRAEFLTSYTPYQAEISQGTLTSVFEFQTMICQLTGMEVANASMYDGSTAMAEAAMMAVRITGRDSIVVAHAVHPEYREVLRTYAKTQGITVRESAYDDSSGRLNLDDLREKVDSATAALIVQSPNFFGVVETLNEAGHVAHAQGALLIHVFTEAVSLGILKPSPETDIVAGELQSFATPPNYGGPFAGVIATRERFIRQLPGRLVGQTVDRHGRRAFCLTLASREQHIRREKATSNICTNQALLALMATVFMTVYGRRGLRELAEQNLAKSRYLARSTAIRFTGPFFNEFVTVPRRKPEIVNQELLEKKIIGGLPLDRWYPELEGCMLLCATEMNRREDMDLVVEALNQ